MSNTDLLRWFGLGGGAAAFLSVIGIAFQAVRGVAKHVANDA